MFRGLANYFYDRAAFGIVYQKEKKLIKRFKPESYPAVMVYQTHEEHIHLDTPRIEYFSGSFGVSEIGGFFEHYSLPEKRYISKRNKNFKVPVFRKLNQDNVMEYFHKMEHRTLVVLFTVADDDISEDILNFAKMMT